MSREEMTRQDELNTAATFFNVRKGGPKEKRIRRVELMGEHTPKPLHFIKVTQEGSSSPLSANQIKEFFESSVGDVGEYYIPINDETKEPWDFALIGFYRNQDAATAVSKFQRGAVYLDSPLQVHEVKPWFIDLYPIPKK